MPVTRLAEGIFFTRAYLQANLNETPWWRSHLVRCHIPVECDNQSGPCACQIAPAMKTPLLPRLWSCRLLLVVGAVLLSSPIFAKERFRLPPPPSPEKVVNNIRNFIQRVKTGVKDASKQTWNAIRDPFINDEEEQQPRSPRTAKKQKGSGESGENSSFARAKEAVPYRYDDADAFDARTKSEAAGTQDEPMIKPSTTPGKLGAPASDVAKSPGTLKSTEPADSTSRRPFMTPEQSPPTTTAPQTSGSTTETLPAPPKATPPGVNPNLEFGRPVPGKRGLVYPPGANEVSENMVDVSDFKTGQIVRDPRTGKLFRVP